VSFSYKVKVFSLNNGSITKNFITASVVILVENKIKTASKVVISSSSSSAVGIIAQSSKKHIMLRQKRVPFKMSLQLLFLLCYTYISQL